MGAALRQNGFPYERCDKTGADDVVVDLEVGSPAGFPGFSRRGWRPGDPMESPDEGYCDKRGAIWDATRIGGVSQ
jgi:hypothetical protein